MSKDIPLESIASALPFDLPKTEETGPSLKELPKDIYYQPKSIYENVPMEKLEEMLENFLAPENHARLKLIATSRGVPQLACLRQVLIGAFQRGTFECEGRPTDGSKEKRTGNDDSQKNLDNIRLAALLSQTNYAILIAHAKPAKLSNQTALNRGLEIALAKEEL